MMHSTRSDAAGASPSRSEHGERERLAARYNQRAWALLQAGRIGEAVALMEEYASELKRLKQEEEGS